MDGLMVLAPLRDSIALAQAVQEQAKLPVLLWRKMNPGIPEQEWATYRHEAAQAAAADLGGYVVHAMITVNYEDYPERLWSVVESAVGGEAQGGD